ncbi:MAG: response regulator [Oligoflexia bacterium]|nr:response regulator [Oligoflexia bacterium]MBF0366325.1 response regulator [Oligoflexia bacterium]
MKKLFGEYLIEKKIVSAEQLLAALIEQIHSMPTLVDIVNQKKLLSANELLSVIRVQMEQRVEFRSACETLGLWNPILEESIQKELDCHRRPIGELLVKRGSLCLETLISAMDDYFSSSNRTPQPPASAKVNIYGPLIPLFATHLNKARMEKLHHSACNGKFEELFFELRLLQGFSKLLNATESSELLAKMEMASLKMMSEDPNAKTDVVLEFLTLFERALTLVRDLRQSIVESQSEAIDFGTIKKDLDDFNIRDTTLTKKTKRNSATTKLRILQVDDSRSVHAYTKEIFNGTQHEVTHAMSAKEAMDKLAEMGTDYFKIILLDWEMPCITGPEFLALLKEKEISIPVVMLTIKNSPIDIEVMLNAGAKEYIMKPFSRELLFEKIEMAIGVSV